MLSRRDKLLIQPWEERRFRDHRSKVQTALPTVDDAAPPPRPHVTMKLKKFQRELDRKSKIQRENYSLLQRLTAIMRVNRLDNYWERPPPNFHHKVGIFFDAPSLNSRLTARSQSSNASDTYANVKCYACELRKKIGTDIMSSVRATYDMIAGFRRDMLSRRPRAPAVRRRTPGQ